MNVDEEFRIKRAAAYYEPPCLGLPKLRANVWMSVGPAPDNEDETLFEQVQKGDPGGPVAFISADAWQEIIDHRAAAAVQS